MTLNKIKALGTSAVCDAMNSLGLGVRSLDNYIVPLNEKDDFCYGPAFTIKGGKNGTEKDKMEGMKVMSQIPNASVIIIDINGGDFVGHWGELMSTAAISKGAVGAVVNGGCRDKKEVANMSFPVFCKYTTPCEAMTLYYMKECNTILNMKNSLGENIDIYPNDLIMADSDGVVVIPKKLEQEILEKAQAIRDRELKAKELLKNGTSVYDTFSKMDIA